MGDSRGCRGGLRRGLRRCRAAPPLPLVVLPPDGVSTLSVCARPRPAETAGRGPHRLCPFSAAAAPACADGVVSGGQKPARPLRGSAAPPCALAAPSRAAAAAGGPSGRLPPSHFFWSGGGWLLRGHSAAVAPFAGLAAGSQGRGACFSGLWPPRRCGGAPLRSSPAPRFWPRGGAILFSLRRVWGLRRLRAALKVYRAARAAQCGCGVHGFAMNPCVSLHVATAPYYREARVTFAWRRTACRMRHCCARRIDETGGKRKLGCTSIRWAERQRIIEAEANRIVKPMAASVSNAATQALSLRRHESCSSSRLPIKAFLLGVKGGYSLSVEREYPP